ncbi:MAG: amidohydrolase family protein [Planctomycetaceae bacterium]
MQLEGRRYDTGEPCRITIDGERIAKVAPVPATAETRDWPWIAPALFDHQINGHLGKSFSGPDITADDVLETLEPHFAFGITRMCPTICTNSFEAILEGYTAIREACEKELWADRMVPGCHLEGPYMAREDGPRGAHPLEHVRPADWDEFTKWQQASGNRIRLVTLAPEVGNAIPFIRRAVNSGVVISIGHTGATPEQIQEAVDAGARLSTHLGNGAHGMIRRHPNYIWEQLGERRLTASIITDGHHLPASVVRSIIGVKGPHNTIITCDCSSLAGCPPGRYDEGTVPVEILDDGRIVVAGQRQLLAGSAQETDHCVATAIEMAGITLAEAIDMAGRNPARLLGFEEIRLHSGSRADLMVFEWSGPGDRFRFLSVVQAGEVRHGALQPA